MVATGPTGFRGATGAAFPAPKTVSFPKEGKVVASVQANVATCLKIWAQARSSVSWSLQITPDMKVFLVRPGEEDTNIYGWSGGDALGSQPEAMSARILETMARLGEEAPGREELTAVFVIARKEMAKMTAVVMAELLIDDLGREEIGEAWENANALRVMSE